MFFSFLKLLYVVFITFAVGVVELIAIPFDPNGHVFHWLSKIHSWTILKVCGVTVSTQGLEHLDLTKTYVIVSNHASQFDIPSVISAFPTRIRMVYKKELERIPFFGWGLKFSKVYISIDRGRGQDASKSLETAIEKIRNGASVLLFAEGTRTLDGKLQPFKRGAFNMAVRAGVPVVPLTINGSYKILQKGSWRVNPGSITLTFGEPIQPPAANGKEAEIALREQVHEVIAKNYINQ